MSINEYQKLYEQHKRLNPQSTISYAAFEENKKRNDAIVSGKLKIISAKQMANMYVCKGECKKPLHKSKYTIDKRGYRVPVCKKCINERNKARAKAKRLKK